MIGRLRRAGAAMAIASVLAACQPPPTGTVHSAAELRLVAPPGWSASLVAPISSSGTQLLGWATNQPVRPGCDATACRLPVSSLARDGIVVVVFRVGCLPNCRLPDAERTLIGGREASSEDHATSCGDLGDVSARAITVSVTPQRQDVLIVCAGPESPAAELDRLLGSITWTVP